jgi:hypothetical protein
MGLVYAATVLQCLMYVIMKIVAFLHMLSSRACNGFEGFIYTLAVEAYKNSVSAT